MLRIISPIKIDDNNIGAVAFVCKNIAKSIKEAYPDSIVYSFSSESIVGQILKNILILIQACVWLLRGDKVAFIYPTIPLYPATSNLKYYAATLLYKLLFAVNRRCSGKLFLIIIDLPKEQEESFNIKKIKISYDKFLEFENRFIIEASKIIFFSEGFKTLVERRNLKASLECAVCSIGYKPQLKMKKDKACQTTKIFYSGELTRSYEKNKLLEVCNSLSDNEELIVCGRNGEWLNELNKPNICYKGYVDSKKHDEIAEECDFGLIMYPDTGYYRYVTPSKLNVYISLNLPVLAITNLTLKKLFETYKVGKCVSEAEFLSTFRKWCDEKEYRDYQRIYEETDFHTQFLDSIQQAFE